MDKHDKQMQTKKVGLLRSCCYCVFCISDMLLWARALLSGFPINGMCANHPDTPGKLRPVPGRPCRNFRGKPLRVDPPQPPNDKVRYIPLTRGLHAIVDTEDYEWLSQCKWSALDEVTSHREPDHAFCLWDTTLGAEISKGPPAKSCAAAMVISRHRWD